MIEVTFEILRSDGKRCTGFNVVGLADLPTRNLRVSDNHPRDFCDWLSADR